MIMRVCVIIIQNKRIVEIALFMIHARDLLEFIMNGEHNPGCYHKNRGKEMLKLQVAFDMTNLEQAEQVLMQVKDWLDIVEIGTPLIKSAGIGSVIRLREIAPDKIICADLKTMDAGEVEAELAFHAGADMITVLGLAGDRTIQAAVSSANRHQKSIVVDLIEVWDKEDRVMRLEQLGVHYLGVHSGYDNQMEGATPLSDLRHLSLLTDLPLTVAGGIGLSTLGEIANCKPEIIIVGSKIISSARPAEAARDIYQALQKLQRSL